MGKKGSRPRGKYQEHVTGYRYYVGMHLIICHIVPDALRQINVGQYNVWHGNLRDTGTIFVYRPELYQDKGGGVACYVDIEFGKEDQDQNEYLGRILGFDNISAHRGVMGAVLNQVYIGDSPYADPWHFAVERTNTFDQWIPEKSPIPYIGKDPVADTIIAGVRRTGLPEE